MVEQLELPGYFLSEGDEYLEDAASWHLPFDQKLSWVVSGFVPRLEVTATIDELGIPDLPLLALVFLLVDGLLIFHRWIPCLR